MKLRNPQGIPRTHRLDGMVIRDRRRAVIEDYPRGRRWIEPAPDHLGPTVLSQIGTAPRPTRPKDSADPTGEGFGRWQEILADGIPLTIIGAAVLLTTVGLILVDRGLHRVAGAFLR